MRHAPTAAAPAAASLFVCLLVAAPATLAQHADIVPQVAGGRIQTSGFVDATSESIPGLRVFGFDFGEEAADPYFAADPGFNAPSGSLPPGSQLRFNVLGTAASGLPANLAYWGGGAGPVTLTGVPSGEELRLNFGAQNATAGAGTGGVAGYAIGTVDGFGSIHRHLNSFLNGSDGNNVAGDGVEPAAGVYVLAVELTSGDGSVQGSLPIWLVFNNGLTERQHDRVIDYVNENLVPEPGTLAGGGLAAAGLLGRRRRRTN
ncbi:MAG TPA: PEP-CTERM sorting domain-containing protein [Tepidisphaeraceae bacterium]|nr:PEP-CTERM sorting domain-containing protein [Tepidisphaeraceae bacterium]